MCKEPKDGMSAPLLALGPGRSCWHAGLGRLLYKDALSLRPVGLAGLLIFQGGRHLARCRRGTDLQAFSWIARTILILHCLPARRAVHWAFLHDPWIIVRPTLNAPGRLAGGCGGVPHRAVSAPDRRCL